MALVQSAGSREPLCPPPADLPIEERLAGLNLALLVSFVLLGIAFRLAQYFSSRSLWLDEALLSRNICARDFLGLTHPLDLDQGASIGFLWLVKACEVLFGCNESALRLVSLASGILTLFLTYPVSRRVFGVRAGVFATAIVAVSPALTYFSAEVKQYGLDATVGLVILLATLWFAADPLSRVRLGVLIALGSLSVWFSHPSVFFLTASGLWLATVTPILTDRRVLAAAILTAAAWGASFLVNYVFFLRPLTHNNALLEFWQYAFLRVPPRSVGDLWQYLSVMIGVFEGLFHTYAPEDSTGDRVSLLALALWAVAVFAIWKENRRALILFLVPFAITLVCASLGKYPARGRLILFCLPGFAIVIGKGLSDLTLFPASKVRATGWIAFVTLLSVPMIYDLYSLARTPAREEVRSAVEYVAKHRRPGDAVFTYTETQHVVEFYKTFNKHPAFLSLDEHKIARPVLEHTELLDWIDRLQGRRAWVVLSHVDGEDEENEGAIITAWFHTRGHLMEKQTFPGASVYLFEVSPASTK